MELPRRVATKFHPFIACITAMMFTAGCATVQVRGHLPLELKNAGPPHRAFDRPLPVVLGIADVRWRTSDSYSWKVLGRETMLPEVVSASVERNEAAVPEQLRKYIGQSGLFRDVRHIPPYGKANLVLELEVMECQLDATSTSSASLVASDSKMTAAATIAGTVKLRTPAGELLDSFPVRATQPQRTFAGSSSGLDAVGSSRTGMRIGLQARKYGQEAFHSFMAQIVDELANRVQLKEFR